MDSLDQKSRRKFIQTSTITFLSALAGCSEETPASTTTSKPSDTPEGSSTTTESETSTTENTTPDPSPVFDLEIDIEEGNTAHNILIRGEIESSTEMEVVVVKTSEDRVEIDVGGVTDYSLDATLEIEGGKEYDVMVSFIDVHGTKSEKRLNTDHIPIAVDPLSTDRLVGAHYYPWYNVVPSHRDWMDRTVSTPTLGEYDGDDPQIVEQHLKWCLEHGIQWLSISWWGPNKTGDDTLRETFLPLERFSDIQFSILYETIGRLEEFELNLDNSDARQRLIEDFQYLADTYFETDNYLHIDDRPVVFIYLGDSLEGDVEAAFQEVSDKLDKDPYVLLDIAFGVSLEHIEEIEIADGVTTYNPYSSRSDIEEVFHDLYEEGLETMHRGAEEYELDHFPVVIPGFNDSGQPLRDNPVLPSSPDRYERVLEQVNPYLDDSEAVLITSFNEWYEDTQVEPSEEYGTAYLEITADQLATKE